MSVVRIDNPTKHTHGWQARAHHCHWPGCARQVPPAMWGCRAHWYALPLNLRTAIWRSFEPGQERAGTPSREYLAAARAAQAWIAAQQPATPAQGKLL